MAATVKQYASSGSGVKKICCARASSLREIVDSMMGFTRLPRIADEQLAKVAILQHGDVQRHAVA